LDREGRLGFAGGGISSGWDGTYEPSLAGYFVPFLGEHRWRFASGLIALEDTGRLWGWGINQEGQLGDGASAGIASPEQVGTASDWLAVSAGDLHSAGIRSDGSLNAWGHTSYGQLIERPAYLGVADTGKRNIPTLVTESRPWLTVSCARAGSARFGQSTLIAGDHKLWRWSHSSPWVMSVVESNSSWRAVSSAGDHVLAVTTGGTLWAWGLNESGQVGDGTTQFRDQPVQIGSASIWSEVSASNGFSLALRTDGSLWAWGANYYSQLGDGTTLNRLVPSRVGNGNNWLKISAGGSHSLALKTDGTLWVWGSNPFGQLGLGHKTLTAVPTRLGNWADWEIIAAGKTHSMAIRKDGSLWSWGRNQNGQLGIGGYVDATAPQPVAVGSKWQMVAAGVAHTLAIQQDGTLWAWGRNVYGELGLGPFRPVLGGAVWGTPR